MVRGIQIEQKKGTTFMYQELYQENFPLFHAPNSHPQEPEGRDSESCTHQGGTPFTVHI